MSLQAADNTDDVLWYCGPRKSARSSISLSFEFRTLDVVAMCFLSVVDDDASGFLAPPFWEIWRIISDPLKWLRVCGLPKKNMFSSGTSQSRRVLTSNSIDAFMSGVRRTGTFRPCLPFYFYSIKVLTKLSLKIRQSKLHIWMSWWGIPQSKSTKWHFPIPLLLFYDWRE